MSGQQKSGTVFFDNSVDTRPAAPGVPQPVSSGEVMGANWTLTRQDFMGADTQAEIDAYLPMITTLQKDDKRSMIEKALVPSRYINTNVRVGGGMLNRETIWQDIAAHRATDPSFMNDIPAKNADEFKAWVAKQEAGRRTAATDVVNREKGFGQKALGFGTGVVSSLADPVNLAGMALTGPVAGGGKTLLSTVARDAITNMAIETAELPVISSNRAQFGEHMTAGDMVGDVGMAGMAGGAFPLGIHGVSAGGRMVANAVSDSGAGRAAQRYLMPWALGRANLEQATDSDVARMFAETVPRDSRTPDAQAALNVLDREADVRGASPYKATPGGLDANAERLTATTEALSQPASAGNAPPMPRPSVRTAPPLTQDGIIKFVINDLEGGAKVVPFSEADGGTTKFGVAKRFNPDVDVANITEADAMRIARQRYWLPEFNTADPRVAAIAFDANWISSPTLARKIIREAGNDVDRALEIYRGRLMEIADTVPGKEKFRKGWNNRVDKLGHYLGDAETSTVHLAPEQFGGDDMAYRAAQEQLNADELRLADDTPHAPDPVREYVDRVQSGSDVSAPEDVRFAADNQEEIAAETTRRVENGTDGHPGPPATRARVAEPGAPSQAETALAVREYVRRGGEPTSTAISRELGITKTEASTALKATVKSDAVSDIILSPIYVAKEGEPGFHIEDTHGDGMLYSVFRDEKGLAKGVVVYPATDEAREPVPGYNNARVIAYIAPEYRRQGIGTKLYDQLRQAGHNIDALSGTDDLTPEGAAFVNARRARLPVAEKAGAVRETERLARPPSLDPKTYGADTATSPEARLLADSAYHDVRALAEAGDTTRAQLTEGGPEMGAKELIESLDKDQAALDAIKGCL